MSKKAHRPFLNAREAAAKIGGCSHKSILNGNGIFAGLTRHKVNGSVVFDANEIDLLISRIREEAERERAEARARQRQTSAILRRHLRAVG